MSEYLKKGDASANFLAAVVDDVDFNSGYLVVQQTVSKWGGLFRRKKLWERRFEITVKEIPCEQPDV